MKTTIRGLKDRYYSHILDKLPVSKEEEIVFALIYDLSNRSGFDWSNIDYETQEEWLRQWIDIVRAKQEGK